MRKRFRLPTTVILLLIFVVAEMGLISSIFGAPVNRGNILLFLELGTVTFPFKILAIAEIFFIIVFAILSTAKTFSKKVRLTSSLMDTKNTKTDIDSLYDSLQEKEEISLSSVSKKFKVSKEVALNWFRILEDSKLAEVTYPSFGEPRIKSYVKKEENLNGETPTEKV